MCDLTRMLNSSIEKTQKTLETWYEVVTITVHYVWTVTRLYNQLRVRDILLKLCEAISGFAWWNYERRTVAMIDIPRIVNVRIFRSKRIASMSRAAAIHSKFNYDAPVL